MPPALLCLEIPRVGGADSCCYLADESDVLQKRKNGHELLNLSRSRVCVCVCVCVNACMLVHTFRHTHVCMPSSACLPWLPPYITLT